MSTGYGWEGLMQVCATCADVHLYLFYCVGLPGLLNVFTLF